MSGQVLALSRRRPGFESRWGRQLSRFVGHKKVAKGAKLASAPTSLCRKGIVGFKVEKKGKAGWILKRYEAGKWRYVNRNAFPVGLDHSWTLERARDFVKSLTARDQELKRQRVLERGRTFKRLKHGLLPADVVEHFERLILLAKPDPTKKIAGMWMQVQRLVVGVALDPSDWALEPTQVHKWVASQGWSKDYAKRVIKMASKYGHLYCRLRGAPFSPIPKLPSGFLNTMEDAFERAGKDKTSLPLQLEQLSEVTKRCPGPEAEWVRVSFWFGLRPEEMDLLNGPNVVGGELMWQVANDVLTIYQPKLEGKTRAHNRYKHIPAWRPEQLALINKLGNQGYVLKRPTRWRVRKCFPKGVTLWGPRKGFTSLMDRLGQPIDKISRWLGHRSVSTTERWYRDMGLVHHATPEKG